MLAPATCAVALACGGPSKPANGEEQGAASSDAGTEDGASAEAEGGKADVCTGFDMEYLDDVLNKVACEVPNMPSGEQGKDLKEKLEVKLVSSSNKVAPGAKVDLIVVFSNKTKEPMPLHFAVDPTPRFETEVYDPKGKRMDQPPGEHPNWPQGSAPRDSVEPKTARVILAAGGSAKVHLAWEAKKMRWAPEKARGTPPGGGFPRAPSTPLPKGKYTVRVVTPLIGVYEGVDKEMSGPKLAIEVGN
jgi:hypothetical protein